MELLILDKDYSSLDIIDSFESFIWTDRYREAGDFEIYTSVDEKLLSICIPDRYLWWKDSEHVMIIEERIIETDVENGSSLCIVGRSLESILDRRIVWKQTILNGNFQDAIQKLLNDSIISPSDSSRRIPNFIFKKSTDSRITSMTVDAQVAEGDNLYDVIYTLCELKDVGFKILLSDQNEMVFELYKGFDRSYGQDENAYVLFSPKFDNVLNSNYYENMATLKNVVLVSGQKSDSTKIYATVGSKSGIDRRESYTDATGMSSTDEEGNPIPDSTIIEQLKQKGNEILSENTSSKSFEGEIDIYQSFLYNEDFYIGDIVQIVNEYGIEARARIDEIVYSENESGVSVIPTLSAIVDEEQEG